MSKRVILFRHAKSDRHAAFDDDHGRPLSDRGVKAAKQMGLLLAAAGQVPPLVLASTARRAKSTIELAMAQGRWRCSLQLVDWLYDTQAPAVLDRIRGLPQDAEAVLLVGHEPTWSQLTRLLIGGGNVRVPTAALVGIDFHVEAWRDIERGIGTLVWLLPPRLFRALA